jgi:hypothetical protein
MLNIGTYMGSEAHPRADTEENAGDAKPVVAENLAELRHQAEQPELERQVLRQLRRRLEPDHRIEHGGDVLEDLDELEGSDEDIDLEPDDNLQGDALLRHQGQVGGVERLLWPDVCMIKIVSKRTTLAKHFISLFYAGYSGI